MAWLWESSSELASNVSLYSEMEILLKRLWGRLELMDYNVTRRVKSMELGNGMEGAAAWPPSCKHTLECALDLSDLSDSDDSSSSLFLSPTPEMLLLTEERLLPPAIRFVKHAHRPSA